MNKVKHTVKDSVFTDLFQDKKYIVQLYKALHHGEEIDISEDEIRNVTLKRILTDAIYNDLGFVVGNRMIVLVEAQSTWTPNIIVRALMYLVQSYQEYITNNEMNIYGKRKIQIPQPELYVIYSGDENPEKDFATLSEEFFDGADSAIDVKVRVIQNGQKGDIIYQYVMFTKIYSEQYKLYGSTFKSIEETIRICRDKDILKEYLNEREKEVVSIMLAIFDDEIIKKTYENSIRKEALAEGKAKGRAEGKAEGKAEGMAIGEANMLNKLLTKLKAMGMNEEDLKKVSQFD